MFLAVFIIVSTPVLASTSCPVWKQNNGKINFLVVPNRNITQTEIKNGTFLKLASDIFFGRNDAYYYSKDASGNINPITPALGFFDISPLKEYKDKINFYYYNKATTLDCDLVNQSEGNPPQFCFTQAAAIENQCSSEIRSNVSRVIVIDRVGWDFAYGTGNGSMWFNNDHTYPYSTGTNTIQMFDTGRVSAHEFGHTLGFAHVNVAPLSYGVIPPVDDAVSYSNSSTSVPNVPINCDTFSSIKWCKGVDTNSVGLKDFQNFLNDTRNQCGTNPTLECEKSIWNSDINLTGRQLLDSSANIGLSCENNSGSYLNSCGSSAFLTSSGDSVMGSDFSSFSTYESKIIRNTLNALIASSSPSVTLSAKPTSITRGQSTTVTWTTSNVTSCTGSDGSNKTPISWRTPSISGGSWTFSPTKTTTLSLTCTNSQRQRVEAKVTITVYVRPSLFGLDFNQDENLAQVMNALPVEISRFIFGR